LLLLLSGEAENTNFIVFSLTEAEILLKVALKHQKSIKSINCMEGGKITAAH
jgi:hypothetical protein